MSDRNLIDTKRLSPTLIRELTVYYDRGGMNYWNNSVKPKGIYMASGIYRHTEGSYLKTWTTDQTGDGYLLIVPFERFSRKQLRLVTERAEANAERIHTMLETPGQIDAIKALLRGEDVAPDLFAEDA